MRIAIVGAGVAGLTASWLLDGRHELVLLEQEDRLGGHARTVSVESAGLRIPVDPAFQHFSGPMYPRFCRLLELLGVRTRRARVSGTFWCAESQRGLLLTPTLAARDVLRSLEPRALASLLRLQRAIRAAERLERRGDWDTSVESFGRALRLPAGFRAGLLEPFLASILGTSLETTRAISARAAFQFPLHHRPRRPLGSFEFREICGGVHGYVEAIRSALRSTRLVVGARIARASRRNGGFLLEDDQGLRIECDHLILATPPPATARILDGLPEWEATRRTLAELSYPTTTIAIHSDPSLMPPDRALWSSFNCMYDGKTSETTLWVGKPMGADVFKSWVTHRSRMPERLHAAYRFQHPLMTPGYFRAQREIARNQGAGGLWLAGSYTRDIDCHESGVTSAIAVAERLGPASPRLRQLLGAARPVARSGARGGYSI